MNALYIIGTYCSLDDTLNAIGHRDHHHARVSTAEILTIAIMSAKYFQNHHERAVGILVMLGYVPRLSVSRFNRRVHQASELLSDILEWWGQQQATSRYYVADTMPLPVCHKVRAEACQKIPQVKGYIGRCSAKREWFCGWRLHWICDKKGFPISFDLVPAVWHELTTLQLLICALPDGASLYGDGAYISHDHQAMALRADIHIIPETHERLLWQNTAFEHAQLKKYRSKIESQHSVLEKMGVQRLHAVTPEGFGVKVYASLAVLALNILLD